LGFHFISCPKNVPEISKKDLEALGFHFITFPSNVPENRKGDLEALGIHFINSPKNDPGIKKGCPELWHFHIATYPKYVPGMTRYYGSCKIHSYINLYLTMVLQWGKPSCHNTIPSFLLIDG
jgi:hypothetical protein